MIPFSVQHIPNGLIYNDSSVKVMAWFRTVDIPFPESMMMQPAEAYKCH